ncbi:hypothetical protein [Sedimenticola hydrogenitrophicus]|uniref:hypothetical protein n=1 Tax=Sedimenticola hydrogenitrophicus TaxID=2967975 RepID=UPI0023AF5E97|nr:hypothetical protein [Sedimenticola hydrogenitrophicus]
MRHTKKNHEELHEERGRQAGRVLASSRTRLSWEDRTSIARRLHDEIVRSGIKPGDIAAAARLGNGTKELNKLAMKADKDPKKAQLLAYPDRYYDVMKALARLTRQNVHLVVDRLTVGTSVHPTRAEQLSDVEKTMRALELLGARVDKELGLFEQYRQTFFSKREFIRRGDLRNWPFYPFDEHDMPKAPTLAELKLTKKALKALGFGSAEPSTILLKDIDKDLFDESMCEYINERLEQYQDQLEWWSKLRDGYFSFWNGDQDDYAQCIEIEALAFLPHVYVGMVFDWSAWGVSNDESAIRRYRQEALEVADQVPEIALADDTGEPRMRLPSNPDFYACDHTWLILYPDRRLTTLVPVLVQTDDCIGSHMVRCTVSKLIELQSAGYITDTPMSGYERLVQIIGERMPDGEYALVDSWLKTGRNLRFNPYLRVAEQSYEARKSRDEMFTGGRNDENG